MRRFLIVAELVLIAAVAACAQNPAPIIRDDVPLEAARAFVHRALILRCFCADNTLSFDANGQPPDAKKVDWTLAGFDLQVVERKSPAQIELDGVRVALRFAADRREWERHLQADEHVRITVADPGSAEAVTALLRRIFSQGIDLPLQRAMPPYWQHYFNPQQAWVDAGGHPDALANTQVFAPTAPSAPDPVTNPVPTHRVEPSYPVMAQRERVKGTVTVRLVVDAGGHPERVAIVTPLGYGLDAATVEAVERFRFTPGTHGDQPVPVFAQVTQEFLLMSPPR